MRCIKFHVGWPAVDLRFLFRGDRICRLGLRSCSPCGLLVLFAPTSSVTVDKPDETESGSAGEQPDEG